MNEQEQEQEQEPVDPSNLPINRNNVKFRQEEYYIEDENCQNNNNINEENENEYNDENENDDNVEEVEYDMNNYNNIPQQNVQRKEGGDGEVDYEEIFGENIDEYLDDKDKENQ